jgi:hypothetical protein
MSGDESNPLAGRIFTIRGQRVILDADLARLYGVATFRLNEAIKRNSDKFPEDFRFQLTREEFVGLKLQSVISNPDAAGDEEDEPNSSQSAMSSRRGASYLPWAFTEHGCLMAATVLNSERAVEMSIYIIRAFVRMREELMSNSEILKRLAHIDKSLIEHDTALQILWKRLQPLLATPPETPKPRIGFRARGD